MWCYVALFMLACASFHISRAITDGLLPNGDFKHGPKPTDLNGSHVIGKFALPQWEISGFVEYIPSGHKEGDMLVLVPEGAYAVRLGNEASIKQKLKVIDNIVKNGDFEEGPYLFANTPWGVLIPPMIEDVHSPLPAWMVESLKVVKYIESNHYSVPQGKRAVELAAGRESVLSQIVRTIPGKTYSLTFSVGDAADGCIGYMLVQAIADRGTVMVQYDSNGTGGFKKAFLLFKATGNRTRVTFLSSNYHMKFDGSLCRPVIDDVFLLSVRNPGRKLL